MQTCRTIAKNVINATSEEVLGLALCQEVQDLLRSCVYCVFSDSSLILQLLIWIIAYLATVLQFCICQYIIIFIEQQFCDLEPCELSGANVQDLFRSCDYCVFSDSSTTLQLLIWINVHLATVLQLSSC